MSRKLMLIVVALAFGALLAGGCAKGGKAPAPAASAGAGETPADEK